jgi:hypothetical protein
MIKNATAWETIVFAKADGDTKEAQLRRIKVPTGWLVAHEWGDRLGPLTFVPDPEHKWDPCL